jgi:hypothetical protein
MKSKFFKATPQFAQPALNVDREGGVIRKVQIVQQGHNKNGSYFNPQFITDLVKGANEQTQGVKSRFGHPNMCSTTLGTFIGRYRDFSENEGKVYADLHLDPITKKTQVEGKGITMFEYIMDMATNNPDMFGNSIHITSEMFEEEVEGKMVYSHIFDSLVASDLVDSPAATDGLFSGSDDLGVLVTEFLDQNPQIFDAVVKKPEIIEDFFSRYSTYLSSKSLTNIDMKFFDKLKGILGKEKSFDLDITLANGDIVTVVTEGEEPKVGDPVNDASGAPVADGEHLTADGSTIITAEGKITEIKPKEDEPTPPADEPTMSEVMQSVTALAKSFQAFKTQFEADTKETREGVELIAGQFSTLDKRVTDMGKTITSKKFDAPPGEQSGKKKTEGGYDPDAVREAREKMKSKNS